MAGSDRGGQPGRAGADNEDVTHRHEDSILADERGGGHDAGASCPPPGDANYAGTADAIAASTRVRPSSMIAKASPSSPSVMQSGGFVKKVFQRTKV